jgi:hypothetical protein
VEEILDQAEHSEKEYDWLGAVESYERALKLLPEDDFSGKAETLERLGYAFYRAAFQAESNEEFRQRLRQAIADYEEAKESYQKLNEPNKGRVLRCDAMNAYMGYWLASGASEKKKLLGECWRLTQEALKLSKESGKTEEYGETFNHLSASALLAFCYEWDYQARKELIKEVASHGEAAVKLLSTVDEPEELARAYAKTAFALSLFIYFFLDLDERENYARKAQSYWKTAQETDEIASRLEMLCPIPCAQDILWASGSEEAIANAEKALEHARATKDRFAIGSAMDWLAYHLTWSLGGIEDPEKLEKALATIIQDAEEARRQYSVVSFISPRADSAWVEGIRAQIMPGFRFEPDLQKKHDILDAAVVACKDGLETAETSGYPYALMFVHQQFARCLRGLAEIESSPEEKRKFLEESLQHANEGSRIGEQIEPLSYWDLGIYRTGLALTKCKLADLATDSETKKDMVNAALLEMEKGVKLLIKSTSYQPAKTTMNFIGLGWWQYYAGQQWSRLYGFTGDKEHLRKAVEIFTEGLKNYQKGNQTSRMAEGYWKIAQAYGELDDHMMAARNFCLASDLFRAAVEKIPQLQSYYGDHAVYMQAWSEIEKARHHHEQQEYGLAKEHFDKAAELYKLLKRWSYLGPNYSAWARVEDGEELSRKERCEEAIKAFECASNLFSETRESVQAQLSRIEDNDEKQMATGIIKASGLRKEYCEARIALEMAKILDKKGNHLGSSRKYDAAAGAFEKISHGLESEQERKEFLSHG